MAVAKAAEPKLADVPQQQGEVSPEDKFRSALEDTKAVLTTMLPDCDSVEDLVEMIDLALRNPSQLQMLLRKFSPLAKR